MNIVFHNLIICIDIIILTSFYEIIIKNRQILFGSSNIWVLVDFEKAWCEDGSFPVSRQQLNISLIVALFYLGWVYLSLEILIERLIEGEILIQALLPCYKLRLPVDERHLLHLFSSGNKTFISFPLGLFNLKWLSREMPWVISLHSLAFLYLKGNFIPLVMAGV